MIHLEPTTLEGHGVRLEPLTPDHAGDIATAAADGEQWRLFYTFVPRPEDAGVYIEHALAGQAAGHMLPWVVREMEGGTVVGSTRYHDVQPDIDRVEIGWTWYRPGWQRTHLNTACKLLLLEHAFERVACAVVGLRTDGLNFRSQRAIEAMGARKDGVVRHFAARKDGSARDVVMYSILAAEWAGVRKHLETRLWRYGGSRRSSTESSPEGPAHLR